MVGPPELLYLQGENRCPYNWSTGGTVGAFLTALRDHGKILGSVCSGCGTVASPPQSYCERCAAPAADYTEVGPRGVVMSWTRVAGGGEGAPLEPPFRYILVRLGGADTSMVHLAPDDERVRIGAVVRPEFRGDRKGDITDIKWFVPADGEKTEGR